jgi:phage protein D
MLGKRRSRISNRSETRPGRLQEWGWDIVEREKVGRVEAEWRDVDAGTRETVTAGEGDPVHRLRHVHGSETEARRAAEAKLRRAERGKVELNALLAGFEPALFAGGTADASGIYPGIDGRFLVRRVEHRLAGALTTRVRAQASDQGDDSPAGDT